MQKEHERDAVGCKTTGRCIHIDSRTQSCTQPAPPPGRRHCISQVVDEDLSDYVKDSPGRCQSAKEGALGMERLSIVGVTGGVEAVVPPPPGLPPNFWRQRRASTSASSIALSAWEAEGEQSAD